MCGYSSHRLRGVSPHSLFYSHCNTISSICRKVVCHPFHWSPDNNFGINHMYFKVHFLNQCCATKLIQKNRTKVTIANSKVKHKYEKNNGADQKSSSWFYSLLCYSQSTTQNTIYITWRGKSKIFLWQATYNSNYTQKMFKIITVKYIM